MKQMYRIAVLAYSSGEVDIIDVPKEIIDNAWHGDVERYLMDHCQYDMDNIHFMQGDINEIRVNTDLNDESFEGGFDSIEEADY